MDREVGIRYTFIDEASSAIQAAAQVAQGAFAGITGAAQNVATSGAGFIGSFVTQTKNFLDDLVAHSKWASLLVGTVLLNAVKDVLGMAADVEQTRVAFETLLGSAPQANNLMEWLTKYSLVTPLTRKELQDTARTFLAFGETLDQTKISVQAVTEATAALGISQDRAKAIADNLGKIYNSDTSSIRFLNYEMWQGVPVTKLLANAVEDGTLKLSGFGAAGGTVTEVTKQMTTAYDAAEKSNRYMNDQIKIAQERLDAAKSAHTVHKATVDADTLALQKLKDTQAANNDTIAKYTTAVNTHVTVLATAAEGTEKLTQEQIKQLLSENKGSEVSMALAEQMMKTFGGASIRQVQTFSGTMSNFADVMLYVVQKSLGIGLDGVVQLGGAFDKMRGAASAAVSFLLNNVDSISNFFNKILSSNAALMGIVAFLIGAFIPFLSGIVGRVIILSATTGALGYAFGILVDKLGGFNKIKDEVLNFFKEIPGWAKIADENIRNFIGTLTGIMGRKYNWDFGIELKVPPSWDQLAKVFHEKIVVPIENDIQDLKDKFVFGDMVSPIPATWTEVWSKLGKDLTDLAKVLKTLFQPVWDTFKTNTLDEMKKQTPTLGQFEGVLAQLPPIIFGVAVALNSLKILGLGALGLMIVGLLAALPTFLGGFFQMFTGLLQAVLGFFNLFRGVFTLNWGMITQGAGEFWQGLLNLFGGFREVFITGMGQFVTGVLNFVANMIDAIIGKTGYMQQLTQGVVDWFKGLKTQADKENEEVWKAVVKWFDQMVTDAGTAGGNMIKAFMNGIIDGAKSAAAKGFLGPLGQLGVSAIETLSKMHFQHGGIVPGPIGQAVPIVAHGGEQIIPTTGGSSGSGGGNSINMNFYGDVAVDSDERMQQFAQYVMRQLSRQTELARMGVGY